MAEVKVNLTGNELIELRVLLAWQAKQIDSAQFEATLKSLGYSSLGISVTIEEQLQYIAERLLLKLQ